MNKNQNFLRPTAEPRGIEAVKPQLSQELLFSVQSIPDQGKTTYDRERVLDLKSALHKFVRRNMPLEAMIVAYDLYSMSPNEFWSEIKTIAVEDVAQPLEIVAVETLCQQAKALPNNEEHSGLIVMRVMDSAKILAEGVKDRRADELLHLLTEHATPQSDQLLVKLRNLPDYVFDKHTHRGRTLGRGYRHFVEVGSQCLNKLPAYEKWRTVWEGIVNRGEIE